jgi:hypothetical protein
MELLVSSKRLEISSVVNTFSIIRTVPSSSNFCIFTFAFALCLDSSARGVVGAILFVVLIVLLLEFVLVISVL